jgi:hypothetical protein
MFLPSPSQAPSIPFQTITRTWRRSELLLKELDIQAGGRSPNIFRPATIRQRALNWLKLSAKTSSNQFTEPILLTANSPLSLVGSTRLSRLSAKQN